MKFLKRKLLMFGIIEITRILTPIFKLQLAVIHHITNKQQLVLIV